MLKCNLTYCEIFICEESESSEKCSNILNCSIYHIFWIVFPVQFDDLLDINCRYIISCRSSSFICCVCYIVFEQVQYRPWTLQQKINMNTFKFLILCSMTSFEPQKILNCVILYLPRWTVLVDVLHGVFVSLGLLPLC